MDNQNEWLTIDKWLEKYGPVWEEMATQIRPCLDGLAKYAATLATEGRTDEVTMLRKRVDAMDGFWFGAEEDHTSHFDEVVARAVQTRCSEPLTPAEKAEVLCGLDLNKSQMEHDLDEDETILAFEELSKWLYRQWNAELCESIEGCSEQRVPEDSHTPPMQMGGM